MVPADLGHRLCLGRARWLYRQLQIQVSLGPEPSKLNQQADGGHFKEKAVMNKEIRWRIISLQAMLVVILAAASGFLFFQGNFVTGMVHDELVAQKIFFPGTDQIKAGGALDPAKFPTEITQYAGQQ